MTTPDESNTGITQAQYEQGIPDRIMPQGLRVSLDCILRILTPTHRQPPYAIEVFGTVLDIEEQDGQAWNRLVLLDCDRSSSVLGLPMNSEGFILTANSGPKRDIKRPEGFIQIGYFLGSTSLSEVEVIQLATQPLQQSSA